MTTPSALQTQAAVPAEWGETASPPPPRASCRGAAACPPGPAAATAVGAPRATGARRPWDRPGWTLAARSLNRGRTAEEIPPCTPWTAGAGRSTRATSSRLATSRAKASRWAFWSGPTVWPSRCGPRRTTSKTTETTSPTRYHRREKTICTSPTWPTFPAAAPSRRRSLPTSHTPPSARP